MKDQIKGLIEVDDILITEITLFDILYTSLKSDVTSLDSLRKVNPKIRIHSIDDVSVLFAESIISPPFDPFEGEHSLDFDTDMSIYNPLENIGVFNDDPIGTINELIPNIPTENISDGISESLPDDGGTLDFTNHLVYHVPIIAISVKAVQNWSKYQDNKIDLEVAATNTTIDAATLTVGSVGGAALGTKFGAFLAPLTGGVSIFAGPIIGTAIGLMTSGSIGKWLKIQSYGGAYRKAKKEYESAVRSLDHDLMTLRDNFLIMYKVLRSKLKHLHEDNLDAVRFRWQSNESFFKRLFYPDFKSRLIQKSLHRMKREYRTSTVPYYKKLRKSVQDQNAHQGGLLLYSQGKSRFRGLDTLIRNIDSITESIDHLDWKKYKLEIEMEALKGKM